MEEFRIHLKTFLGLAMPKQNSLSESKYQAGFRGPKSLNIHDPYTQYY